MSASVRVVSDALQALAASLTAFTSQGDEVVVFSPGYPPFREVVNDLGRRVVEVALSRDKRGSYHLDAQALREAMNRYTAAIVVCNPHNPTGLVFSREELSIISELAEFHDVVVIADEIHADFVFGGKSHVPFCSIPGAEARTLTISAPTKSFGLAGLRAAVIHFGSDSLADRFAAHVSRFLLSGPSILAAVGSIAAWDHGSAWLKQVLEIVTQNRESAAAAFGAVHVPLQIAPADGTYFLWIDCSLLPISDASEFFRHRAGVAMSAGSDFGTGLEKFMRLNIATAPEILNEILDRVIRSTSEFS